MKARTAEASACLLKLRVPACMQAMERLMAGVDAALGRVEAPASVRHDMRLVAEEACANVIRHAYSQAPRPGDLSVALHRDMLEGVPALRLVVCDHGRPFDPLGACAPALDLPAEERPIGGLGIHLIRSLTDRQRHTRDRAGRNCLELVKWLHEAPE
ncbi:ATP-binding protein [Ramlibacter rhizophilus]|uniref:ATP-binding protein n=1 Tax=Ramlibacter rhizophilus TaxID=1781167 RepID=A0A4Z0BBF5_9BURK|nr:ATP-binding protein [Ramlibacter rhizophilus]TFY96456.1 ATP-binding protein [Ramlibacter rhizophilus]